MSARILMLDIETAPSVGYVWGKWDQNVIKMLKDWYILSFAWKWLDEKGVNVKALCDYRGYRPGGGSDFKLLADLHPLLDEADIVVAHNGDAFDIKKINARFLYHKFDPPSTFKTIDTLKSVKKHFRLDSNSLPDVAAYLGLDGKVSTGGFSLWEGCIGGDDKAWKVMKEYNVQDVRLLEDIYLCIRPWINHPDVTVYNTSKRSSDRLPCPACDSERTQKRGTAVARSRKYQRHQCQDCGHWFPGEILK